MSPQKGPQERFLASRADICVYGGSAGGGKSWALLVEPLRYLTGPRARRGFNAVIFRRTYPEITNPGGLWDESTEIYTRFGATPRQGNLDWTFPPYGNTISFHHLQHEANKYQWQGSQVAYFGFDELSHFTESQFTYVALSRGRSTCGVRPYVRGTTNPDPGWVKSFLAPWVDREHANPAQSGEVRNFIREQGVIRWVPDGHPDSKSLSFIRASVYDNRILLQRNPEYLASLKALLPVERARLLDGDWDVRREGLVYPEFDSCVVDHPAGGDQPAPDVGGIDFGFSNPFACVWGHVDHDGVLWITGMRYVRQCTIPTHAEAIPKGVRYWCDPALPESRVELRNYGHDAIPCVHLRSRGSQGEQKKPILHGIDLVTERIRSGRLKVVRSACRDLIREAGMYAYDPEKLSENPVDRDNHACFPGGTIITTRLGDIPIDQVRAGDEVLTRDGWMPVKACGETGVRSIWRLRTSDGYSLFGTPDHLVWTQNRGWVRIDALRYGDIIDTVEYSITSISGRAWENQRKRLSSRECLTGVTLMPSGDAIESTLPARRDTVFIRQFGSMPTVQFRPVMTCTTGTAIPSTTTYLTCNASAKLITTPSTLPSSPTSSGSRDESGSSRSDLSPENGTAPKPVASGTGSMDGKPGWVVSRWRRLASIAAERFKRRTEGRQPVSAPASAVATPERPGATTTCNGIAPFAARRSRSTPTLDSTPAPVFVVSSIDDNRQQPVYNLTVDGTPEFYANGVLVHNCDALRYLVVGLDRGNAAPAPVAVPNPEPVAVEREPDLDDDRWWR